MRSRFSQNVVCMLAIFLALAPVFGAPKKKKSGGKEAPAAEKTQIEFVAEIGSSMNSNVLAPIDQRFNKDIRPDLISLRDNVLDEAKAKPAASPETYATAGRLINAWLSALQERETRRATMGFTPPPTTDMDHGKKMNLNGYWRNILNYKREKDEAREKKATDKQKRAYFKDADINNWRLRTDVLRPNLESLYSQFRAQLRQGV